MTGTRDTARDLEDAPDYTSDAVTPNMVLATGMDEDEGFPLTEAQKLGRECYESSTNWLNAGRRLKWADSLRAFQGLHPSGSKYLSGDYKYRSRLFTPKTRSMVRKGEAETAAAFFSNEDVVSISAQDDDDKQQQASAAIMGRLLQYRLTKTIPWFQTLVGARQDADVMGICIGKAYWRFAEKKSQEFVPHMDPMTGMHMLDEDGTPLGTYQDKSEKMADHPWIDLIAPENFRFDPGADWRNPIATSPYTIELIPMYVTDVKAKVKSGEWLYVSDSAIMGATNLDDDTTRRAREQGRVPGKDHDTWKPRDFDICWVRENIIRKNGKDWHFYSLSGGGLLLSKPQPLEQMYLHGIRPYVAGSIVLEAHKVYPSGKVELIRDLQTETNDVRNLRLDNVKLALQPKTIVAKGKGIDPQDVRVHMPGKVIMAQDPRNDIVWDRPPEVTASAYSEQDRINMDFDELTGGISNSSIQGNRQVYEAVGNMEMMQGNSSQIGEYEQRLFAETFVEPLIRHLVKLEQAYETDPVILAIAGQEAQLFQKFGLNQITDQLLQQELSVKVNVGIGATNPKNKLNNLATAGQMIGNLLGPKAAQAIEPEEVIKEIFGLCGYKDGARFFKKNFNWDQQGHPDPAMAKVQAQVQMAQQKAQADMQIAQQKLQSDMQLAQAQQQAQARQDAEAQAQERQTAQFEAQLKVHESYVQSQLKLQEIHAKAQADIQREHIKSQSAQMHALMHGKPNEDAPEAVYNYDDNGNRI